MFGYGWGIMHSYNNFGAFGIFGWVLSLLFWFLVILLIVSLLKHLFGFHESKPEAQGEKSPLDILKERYAKGEVTKEEFDRIKKDLS